jgi:group I intron endonuclease
MEKISGVYTITCTVNERRYVGSSGSIHNRWKYHRSMLNSGQHPIALLQSDWNEHGAGAFQFRVVAKIAESSVRLVAEQALLDAYEAVKYGYNVASGVIASTGTRLSDEHKMAISAANKGVPKTAEHRAKLSAAHKALWDSRGLTPEIRERMAELGRLGKGRPKSAETRQRMSEAQKGKTLAPEHLANIRTAHAGLRPTAILDEDKVREIKRRLADTESKVSLAALGREFKVSPLTISDIKHGRTWRDITIE